MPRYKKYRYQSYEEFIKMNPHERSRKPTKSKLVYSLFRLAFVPSTTFPYWPALFFLLSYIFWIYANTIFAFLNLSWVVPVFDTFWTGILWGSFMLFLSILIGLAANNYTTGLKTYLLAENSAVTFCAKLSTEMRNSGNIEAFHKTIDYMYAYMFMIKIVARGEEIKISKLPLSESEKKELSEYSDIEYFTSSPHGYSSSKYNKLDRNEIIKDRRYHLTKGDLYLEATYSLIARYMRITTTCIKSPDYIIELLFALLNDVNTKVDELGSAAITKFTTAIIEVFTYAAVGSIVFLGAVYYQLYGVWLGLFFYALTFLTTIGTAIYANRINNPFVDPDLNPYVSFGLSAAKISNTAAAKKRFHQYEVFERACTEKNC